jgi:hypothetical protein
VTVVDNLTKRLNTAEGELERLKRKRKDSVSPDRVVTKILQRPVASPPSARKSPKMDTPPTSVKPAPKKSRTRRNRFEEQVVDRGTANSAGLPHTSSNQDGVREKKKQSSPARKRDPVLNNPPSSVRRKNDIINEIEESAKTLSLSVKDTSLVFHRSNVDDQVVVTKKALAYVETLMTTTCVYLLKGAKVEGNPVQAYLSTLSLSRIQDLQKEVDSALEQCEDSSKHMAVYRGGVDLAQRVREQSFSSDPPLALRPHKVTDSLHKLHQRLGCHTQHHIPIGFFYAKWSEKLHFHLFKLQKLERSLSFESSLSRSRTPSPAILKGRESPTKLKEEVCHVYSMTNLLNGKVCRDIVRKSPKMASSSAAVVVGEDTLKEVQETRAAIFEDAKDGLLSLSKHHKAVFRYRQDRRQKWQAAKAETMLNESAWNAQYDREALKTLQETEEALEALLEEHLTTIGDGPAGQESN